MVSQRFEVTLEAFAAFVKTSSTVLPTLHRTRTYEYVHTSSCFNFDTTQTFHTQTKLGQPSAERKWSSRYRLALGVIGRIEFEVPSSSCP